MCDCSWLYRNLLFFQAATGFLEFVCMMVRVGFFGASSNRSTLLVAGFIVDWLTTFGPTLVGIFVVIVFIVLMFRLCLICFNTYLKIKGYGDGIPASGMFRKVVQSKSIRRFIILDCNCPCYKPRPKFRFRVRLTYLVLCFILRIIAIALYASARFTDNGGTPLAATAAVSLVFIFITLSLDIYRYRVWWHYTPSVDTQGGFRSKKHERYIPYHIIGNTREPSSIGNAPCPNRSCPNLGLDHIAIFHSNEYQPQRRWCDVGKSQELEIIDSNWPCEVCRKKESQPHYIGFHTTEPQFAVAIAHSNFKASTKGWLGAGVYFARSVQGTVGKHRSTGGAWIIAEIRMGKVYEIERTKIDEKHKNFDRKEYEFVHYANWQEEYDTCYMIHENPTRDEFAIKDAEKQIVKWVMVVDEEFDRKVKLYGMDTEYDTTRCWCI